MALLQSTISRLHRRRELRQAGRSILVFFYVFLLQSCCFLWYSYIGDSAWACQQSAYQEYNLVISYNQTVEWLFYLFGVAFSVGYWNIDHVSHVRSQAYCSIYALNGYELTGDALRLWHQGLWHSTVDKLLEPKNRPLLGPETHGNWEKSKFPGPSLLKNLQQRDKVESMYLRSWKKSV